MDGISDATKFAALLSDVKLVQNYDWFLSAVISMGCMGLILLHNHSHQDLLSRGESYLSTLGKTLVLSSLWKQMDPFQYTWRISVISKSTLIHTQSSANMPRSFKGPQSRIYQTFWDSRSGNLDRLPPGPLWLCWESSCRGAQLSSWLKPLHHPISLRIAPGQKLHQQKLQSPGSCHSERCHCFRRWVKFPGW